MSHFVRSTVSSLFVAAALVVSPGVLAQSDGGGGSVSSSVGSGTLGLGGALPGGGGGMIQAAYFLTPTGALRLGFELNLQSPNGATQLTVGLNGGYRIYFARSGAVAPFVEPGLRLTINPQFASGFGLGLYGGVGAEYFFTPQLAVGVMARLDVGFTSISGAGGTGGTTNVGINTGMSNFFATFYW